MAKKKKSPHYQAPPRSVEVPAKPARPAGPSATARRARARTQRRRAKTLRGATFFGAVVLVLGGLGVFIYESSPSTQGYNTTTTAWVLPQMGGGPKVSLASLRGEPVVVNMFASWCVVCKDELPVFAHDAKALQGKVRFVEINSMETGNGPAMAQQYGLARAGAVVLSDVGGAQGSGLHDALGGGNEMPVTAFYSPTGTLLFSHVGAYSASTLTAALRQYYGVNVH